MEWLNIGRSVIRGELGGRLPWWVFYGERLPEERTVGGMILEEKVGQTLVLNKR